MVKENIYISLFLVFIYCQNPKALWTHLVRAMIYERVNGKEDEWSEIRIDTLSLQNKEKGERSCVSESKWSDVVNEYMQVNKYVG